MNNLKVFIMSYLKRGASVRVVAQALKLLRVDELARKVYFILVKPKSETISWTMQGILSNFYAKTYNEFIYFTQTSLKVADEREVLGRLLDQIKPGDTVYDIGAFLGLHAVFFAKRVGQAGRVIAFEPSGPSYQSLKNNILLNNLLNVTCLNIALGDRVGVGVMKPDDMKMYSPDSLSAQAFYQKTEIVPGDTVVKNNALALPNVVKIDVEGQEYAVLQGLRNTLTHANCRIVCCEVHPQFLPSKVAPSLVIDLLKEMGFIRIERVPVKNTDVFHVFAYKG